MWGGFGVRGILAVAFCACTVFLLSGTESVRVDGLANGQPVLREMPVGEASRLTIDPAARRAGADESWWKTVSERIAREEYQVSVGDRGLQAPNRTQGLRTYFREGKIEVVQRSGENADSWHFTWRTVRWGREDDLVDVDSVSAEPQANGARVTYAREGLEEWYKNKPEGLEQGFTVRERPQGDGDLLIEGRIGGDLRAVHRRDDGAVDFLDANGAAALRYAGLVVRDADGREVPSRLELRGDGLAIVIADAGTPYPLTVDPLMTSPAWTAEGGQSYAYFGYSVGTAGDVNRDGYSEVIVGAPGYGNGEAGEGRAYVYLGSAAGLATSPAWTAESDQAGAYFGCSVGTAGDVNGDGYSDVIVGARFYSNGEPSEGRAYVYQGSAAGLATSPAWTAESDQASAYFGCSVGTAGDVNGDSYSDVIVGARLYSHGQDREGRAYVYQGSAAGLATSPAWTAESNQYEAHFGTSVGTAGDANGDGYSEVIVGAPGFENGQFDEGRAYVYQGSEAGLATSPAWTAESDQVSAYFGHSVGTAGDVNGDGYSDVIVGAYNYDNGESDEGRAYVYQGSAAGLATSPAWTAESDQASAYFGVSVGTAGDVNGDGYSDVIVGAHYYDNGESDEGRAYVYQGSEAGLATSPAWTAESDHASAYFGMSVGTAGDVNGGGYSDVIVGAPYYGEHDDGRAYVYQDEGATRVAGGLAPGSSLLLGCATPNPFSVVTAMSYTLPRRGHTRLAIYDVAGREVAKLADGEEESGPHAVWWDGTSARGAKLTAGVYFARLAFAGREEARKIVLTR